MHEKKVKNLSETQQSGWSSTIYTYIHDIFFSEFPIMLHEWLLKLSTKRTYFQGEEPREWTSQLIEQLEEVSNPISRDVYFWIDNILEVYITEFIVDTITSYSEAERKRIQGPHSRYLSSLKTWIKMLLCEKGILRMLD